MNNEKMNRMHDFYKQYLLEESIRFWTDNGPDYKYGGILTCLDREGRVYNTDKSVWFQGRAAWMFSRLYNTLEKREDWLNTAKLIYDFLVKYCFDADGRMFFTVTQDGRPLQKRRYIFSETFTVIACAEYARAAGDETALAKAREVYDMIIDIYRNPSGIAPKIIPETRKTKGLALPMILLATTQSLREIDPQPRYDELGKEFVNVIFRDFYKASERALFETVGLQGERLDSPQGRCINPGHSIEAAWFIMHEGVYRKDKEMIDKALKILDCSLEIGWDKVYGGLLYFVDIEGKPAEQLEWDMKLWWPHTEALYATLLAYSLTGDEKYEVWFDRVHDWSFSHFADKEHKEWFGYLHRDGSVSNTLKGSMWKGPFHLPRALLLCLLKLEDMMKA